MCYGSIVIRKPAVLAVALVLGCSSNHHVSPWSEDFKFENLLEYRSSVEESLKRISSEMAQLEMELSAEVKGTFGEEEPFVIRQYTGKGSLGPRHAVRVATNYGVVLAVGPSEGMEEEVRGELVGELGGWRSGTDLNRDGLVDVILRGADETLEVWAIHAKGATPYPMLGVGHPKEAQDVDQDGRPDFAAHVRWQADDPIAPQVIEVMTFSQGAYRWDTASARAFHERELRGLRKEGEVAGELRVALEAAWHKIRSGATPAKALLEADQVAQKHAPLGAGLIQSWIFWRGFLAGLDGQASEQR